jgi:hypothetical protein
MTVNVSMLTLGGVAGHRDLAFGRRPLGGHFNSHKGAKPACDAVRADA